MKLITAYNVLRTRLFRYQYAKELKVSDEMWQKLARFDEAFVKLLARTDIQSNQAQKDDKADATPITRESLWEVGFVENNQQENTFVFDANPKRWDGLVIVVLFNHDLSFKIQLLRGDDPFAFVTATTIEHLQQLYGMLRDDKCIKDMK